MKQTRKILAALLAVVMVFAMFGTALAAEDDAPVAAVLAEQEAPKELPGDSNQLPLTGFFCADLAGQGQEGREVYIYIPATAVVRPYYHYIAIPNGVEAGAFLQETGWFQVADETGECLYVLVPGEGGWGDPADELDYMKAAKNFHGGNGKDDNGNLKGMAPYFTTFGEFYLTGYGEGAAALETWAANFPHFVIAQAYVNGESAGAEVLAAGAANVYGLKHMTDGDIRGAARVDEEGNQKIMKQFQGELAEVLNAGTENAGLLTAFDMPVPTYLVNEAGDSLEHWKAVNRASAEAETAAILGDEAADVFAQQEATWATEYSGNISKVVAVETEADVNAYEFTRELRNALTDYTRYDNTVAYGNGLFNRVDYTALQVERYTTGEKVVGEVTGINRDGSEAKAEMTIMPYTVSVEPTEGRYESDTYLADLLIYVPETAPETNIPVVVVWHGGSQTGNLFFDATMWWQTAAKEGFALALPTRTDHIYRTIDSVSRMYDVDLFNGAYEILAADGRFDMTRVYTSGQSMGSVASIAVSQFCADKLAAFYGTNASAPNPEVAGGPVPAAEFVGEGNYDDRGIPGFAADTSYDTDNIESFVRSSEAAAAGADIYWDPATETAVVPNQANFKTWTEYYMDQNGVTLENLNPNIRYSNASALNGGTNKDDGTLAEWKTNLARYRTFQWENEDGIPVIEYTFAMWQAHNCQPGYRPVIWDFLKHYSVVDGVHYYSASAFAEDDAVALFQD